MWISDRERADTAEKLLQSEHAEEIMKNRESVTGAYLSGRHENPGSEERRHALTG